MERGGQGWWRLGAVRSRRIWPGLAAPGLDNLCGLALGAAHSTGDLRGCSERRCGAGKGPLDGEGKSAATELAGVR